MKKAISTILALAMLATPLVGSTCFADEPAGDIGAYVQNQERSERFKLDKKIAAKAGKIAGCVAAGTAAVVGTTVAGLKICERVVPESIKEYLPFLFKKANKEGEESETVAHSEGNTETAASSDEVPATVASSTEEPKVVARSEGNPETAAFLDEVPETVASSTEESETVAPPSVEEQDEGMLSKMGGWVQGHLILITGVTTGVGIVAAL